MISPHVSHLADSLCRLGYRVTYVYFYELTQYRISQGWTFNRFLYADVVRCSTLKDALRIINRSSVDSVHICGGLRSNGLVGWSLRLLLVRGRRVWIQMETVNDQGRLGWLKRLVYRLHALYLRDSICGVLAIGDRTMSWLSARGFREGSLFPFAYFISHEHVYSKVPSYPARDSGERFEFLYVGGLLQIKNVDLLVRALAKSRIGAFRLTIVGDGPLKPELMRLAESSLQQAVRWLGWQPMDRVPDIIAAADCLVLPSHHDGWGVVISEALLNGTRVICSDNCGSANLVRASGAGDIFKSNNCVDLTRALEHEYRKGSQPNCRRARLNAWSRCLTSEAGAQYLQKILNHSEDHPDKPMPPWELSDIP